MSRSGINNLGTSGRTYQSVSLGNVRNTRGSIIRAFNFCNINSPDLNYTFNCTFNTNYFTKNNNNNNKNKIEDYYLAGLFYYLPGESLKIQGRDGALYFNNTIYTENQNATAYLVKYNNIGIPQWATKIGIDNINSYVDSNANSSNIVVGNENNIYTCGLVFNGDAPTANNLNFYNTGNYIIPGIQLSISNEKNIYIAKYNTDGLAIWATYIKVNSANNISVTTDSENNVYVAFSYGTQTDTKIYETNNNTEVKTYTAVGGNTRIMIVKYNSTGKYKWSTIIAANDINIPVQGTQICCDKEDNPILSGFAQTSQSKIINVFNYDNLITPISTITLEDYGIFIVKFNKTGTAIWDTKINGKGSNGKAVLTTDLNNNIYICGFSDNNKTPSIYNANGLGTPTLFATLPNSIYYDTFLVKFNSNGAAQWYSRISGLEDEYQPYISTHNNGNIIVAGTTNSSPLEIYDSNNYKSEINLQSPIDKNTFIINFKSNGILDWATYLGPNFDESRVSISCDNKNNIVVTGDYDEQTGGYDMKFYKPNGSDPIEALSLTTHDSSNNFVNTFIVKYNDKGIPEWCGQNYASVEIPIISTPYKR
jgi:hypothetical protein